MKAIGLISVMVLGLMLCMPASAVSVQSISFVGNVEGLWYYENSSLKMGNGFLIADANGDGIADALLTMVDESNGILYIGALSGSGRIAFNNSTQIWGWLEVKNFSRERDKVLAIEDVNGDGVCDIAVTNDSLNTSHVVLSIISGKNGEILKTNVFSARNATFCYSLRKVIDMNADGISELLLVMNHTVVRSFGNTNYYEYYIRVYAIDPLSGGSIWANPIDKGPLNFPYPFINPYLVFVSPDVSGNNKPDVWIVASGLNLNFGFINFNNSEICVIDGQTQNLVWERKDLASGLVLDFRIYDFTGDGICDGALSKVSLSLTGIAGNYTEVLYGNNGSIASKLSHPVSCIFEGFPSIIFMLGIEFGFYQELLSYQEYVDFTGDNVSDLLITPFDFMGSSAPFNFMGFSSAQGNLTLLNVKANATVWQTQMNSSSVLALIYPCDVNGDGIREIYTLSSTNLGQEFGFYSGRDGRALWSRTFSNGSATWAVYASALSTFSELDGDGKPDFVFAEPLGNSGGYENVLLTALSGPTGNVIYEATHSIAISSNDTYLSLMQAGDISGDGINDIVLYVSGQSSANTSLSYSYALNGSDGSAMWYCVLESTEGEQAMLLGAQMLSFLSHVPSTQSDLNHNGLSDDAIVGCSNGVYVLYTIPGSPVFESFWPLAFALPTAFGIFLLRREEGL